MEGQGFLSHVSIMVDPLKLTSEVSPIVLSKFNVGAHVVKHM